MSIRSLWGDMNKPVEVNTREVNSAFVQAREKAEVDLLLQVRQNQVKTDKRLDVAGQRFLDLMNRIDSLEERVKELEK